MKGHFLLGAACVMAAAPVMAGPYANVETNSGFGGSDYSGTLLETHFGGDIELSETAAAYVQAGPAFLMPDDGDSDTEFSGKAGLDVAVTEKLGAYGEYAFMTGDEDLASNVKLGLKYSF